MYVAEQYQMPAADIGRRLAAIRVGNLITYDRVAARPVATFLPWVFAAPDRLLTHVGRVNDQWRHTAGLALVVADGLHAPVEAGWRASHAEGRSSPGLDYESVHVWGELSADESLAGVLESWERLMAVHSPEVRIGDLDPVWLESRAKATVALSLRIQEVQGKSKLSQAESVADIDTIARGMADSCPALAERVLEIARPYAQRRETAVAEARRRSGAAATQWPAGVAGRDRATGAEGIEPGGPSPVG
jgi:predicted FMN-binding regulatory protein PaiB